MNNLDQFKKDFKRDILVKIALGLKHEKISANAAQNIAKNVIEILQEESAKDVFSKLNKLSESYLTIADVSIPRMEEYDEREKETRIPEILIYLKGGEIN